MGFPVWRPAGILTRRNRIGFRSLDRLMKSVRPLKG